MNILGINKNPAGKIYNIIFGIACIIDGVVRVVSLGFLDTRLPLEVSKKQAQKAIQRLKDKRDGRKTNN